LMVGAGFIVAKLDMMSSGNGRDIKEWIETPQLLCEVQGHYASQVGHPAILVFFMVMMDLKFKIQCPIP
jgi:hypothetical protein